MSEPSVFDKAQRAVRSVEDMNNDFLRLRGEGVNALPLVKGERHNAGKAKLSYLTVRGFRALTASQRRPPPGGPQCCDAVLGHLEAFEDSHDIVHLKMALRVLGLYTEEIARVLATAAESGKYKPWNWVNGFTAGELLDSILRHALRILEGQEHDEESGFSHIAHIGCNLLFMHEFAAHNRLSKEGMIPLPARGLLPSGASIKVGSVPLGTPAAEWFAAPNSGL